MAEAASAGGERHPSAGGSDCRGGLAPHVSSNQRTTDRQPAYSRGRPADHPPVYCGARGIRQETGGDVSEFAGKGAVITGGGRGIGLACARLIAERGGTVVLLGHDRAMVEDAASGLRDDGLKATAVVADISAEAEVE